MRDPELHDSLREFALEAAALLSRELARGAELPFEVLEEGERPMTMGRRGARGPVLYRYRPLTATFVGQRWPALRDLETYGRATAALGSGATAYLRHRGLPDSGQDAVLRDLIERLFDDSTSFDFPEDRFQRLHAELDATLEGQVVRASVIAPLHGLRIASGRVRLRDGLTLVRRSVLDSPPTALEGAALSAECTAEVDGGEAGDRGDAGASPLDVLCLFERELPRDAALPIDDARTEFRRTLTALRLCGAGGSALGPLAWARTGRGAWHPVALGVSARARPESWELRHGDESELRDLLEILALSRHGETTGWALSRFEMGCERELEVEALSDYLLAVRALLGEPGAAGEAGAASRLAALCAPEPERADMRRRAELAFALERELVHGTGGGGTLALDSPRAMVREIEQHLRALLRDVLCGYLREDLRAVADEVGRRADGPPEEGLGGIQARDTRPRPADDQPTEELEALDPDAVPGAGPPEGEPVGAAVTPSIDWEAEE